MNAEPSETEMVAVLNDARRAFEARRKGLLNQLVMVDSLLNEVDRALRSLNVGRPTATRKSPGPSSVIKPAVSEILKAAQGQPVHASVILEGIQERGISVSEKDPKATIVTALLRMHRNRLLDRSAEGVEKMGKNYFRWVSDTEGTANASSEPLPPSALFPASLLALTSQRERTRP